MLRQLALRGRQLGVTNWSRTVSAITQTSRLRLFCTMVDGEQKARKTPTRRRRKASLEDPDQENGTASAAQGNGLTPSNRKPASSRAKKAKTSDSAIKNVADCQAKKALDAEDLPSAAVASERGPGPVDAAAGETAANGAAAGAASSSDQEQPAEGAAKPKKKRTPRVKWPPGPLYDSSMRPPKFEGPAHRFLSWNVAGMRALIKKDAESIKNLVQLEQLDAVCLQEHKLQLSHVEEVVKTAGLEDWHVAFNCSIAKKGYSGTATLCREKPLSTRLGMGIEEHDDEGRVVTVELKDLYLVNVYVPNSSEGLRRLDYRITKWDKALADYIKSLHAQGKPVVVTGDFNCAHQEIDIHDPKGNLRSAGFTQEERDSFGAELLGRAGLVDTWRAQHPGIVGYTYYSYRFNMRDKGKGWRLDYFLVTNDLAERIHDSYILKEIKGSDHAPLGIVIKKAAEH